MPEETTIARRRPRPPRAWAPTRPQRPPSPPTRGFRWRPESLTDRLGQAQALLRAAVPAGVRKITLWLVGEGDVLGEVDSRPGGPTTVTVRLPPWRP